MDIKLKSSEIQRYVINGMLLLVYGYILVLGYSEGQVMGITCAIALILTIFLLIKEAKILFTVIALNSFILSIKNKELTSKEMKKEFREWPKGLVFSKKFNEGLYKIVDGVQEKRLKKNQSEESINTVIDSVINKLDTPIEELKSNIEKINVENISNEVKKVRQKEELVEKLVLDIFETAKAMNYNLPINREDKDLNYILKQICAEYNSVIIESEVIYDIDIQSEPFISKIDTEKFYEVMAILLENAEKHSLKGSRIYIKTRAVDEKSINKGLVIEIKNISKEKLNIEEKDLLEYIVKKEEKDITGLALERCKALIKKMDGVMKIKIDGDLFKVVLEFREEVKRDAFKSKE